MIKSLLRKPYRKLLTKLTIKTINKHDPKIIAVMGDGQTSIGREIVYTVLKDHFPVRRNLESPESEFSVPLTALGYLRYPKNYFEWLKITLKIMFSLAVSPKYNHFLIFELNFFNPDILHHWLITLKPEAALITGSVPLDYSELGIKKVVKISGSLPDDLIKPFEMAAMQIGRFYRLKPEQIDRSLAKFTLPISKIRIFPGINNSTIIDATHFQFPIKIDSALELVDKKDSHNEKVAFTNSKRDKTLLKNAGWRVNPTKYQPKNNSIIIIRGNRKEMLQKYDYLFESNTPLF